jgi:ABC-2 type transport system permease protein
MITDPMHMVFLLGMPVMMTWAMSFLPKVDGVYEMSSLGVLVMFVALGLITSASAIIQERQGGTWQRILTSPTSYWSIMAGHFIKLFVTAWVQALILLLSGKFLFGAPWNGGYLEMGVVLTMYIFAMTGLGLFLASILKTQGQVQAVSTAIVMVGTMLGDVFFPIENPSGIIRLISTVSPQSWAAHALKDILTVGTELSSLTIPLLWLFGIGTLLLAAGAFRIGNMEG